MRLHGSPTVERMPRTPRRVVALLLAGATLASLAACAPAAPAATDAPTDSPDATGAPIFASDEEALAAAVAAYEQHLAITAQILAGDIEVERIREATAPGYGDERVRELESFIESGLRASGSTTIDTPSLIERHEAGGLAIVSIYACQDVSATRLLNSAGQDVTPGDREDRVPLVLEFRGSSAAILVSGNQLWSGDDFC